MTYHQALVMFIAMTRVISGESADRKHLRRSFEQQPEIESLFEERNLLSGSVLFSPTVHSQATTIPPSSLDVRIPAQDMELEGTLRLPSSDFWPAPAVVLIHGSGPHSRDGVLMGQLNQVFPNPVPVFLNIAESLQAQGIAVLSYDKRTCGNFNGCANNSYPVPNMNMTIDTFIDDALEASRFLAQRPEICSEEITVSGHSQSGQFIPILLELEPSLKKGIMLAAPFKAIDQLVELQLNSTIELLVKQGINASDAQTIPGVKFISSMVDGLREIRTGSNEPVAGVSALFWKSWFEIQTRALQAAGKIHRPLLVMNGENDMNVPPSEAEEWAEWLAKVNTAHELVIFPCVTHALNCVNGSDVDNIVSSDVTARMTSFLLQ